MNFEGKGIVAADTSNIQAQIDAIYDQINILQDQIDAINVALAAIEVKLDTVASSAVGNFTPFNFSDPTQVDLTPFMTPVIGNGIFIPFELMSVGMSLKVTVWTTIQNNPSQDFRMYLGNSIAFNYTSTNYESLPVNVTPVTKKFVYTINIPQLSAPSRVNTITETMYGLLFYHDAASGVAGDFPAFSAQGGIDIHFIANWRVLTALQNFTVNYVTVERTTGFI